MINPCQAFGYNVEEGMKIFTIVEMFVSVFHLVMAGTAYKQFNAYEWHSSGYGRSNRPHGSKGEDGPSRSFSTTMIMIFYIVFCLTMVVQVVFGFLLHFIGYKQRNKLICLLWLIFAGINFSFPWIILIFCLIDESAAKNASPTSTSYSLGLPVRRCWQSPFLYLLYLILGAWIVFVYMKSLKGNSGRGGQQATVTPSNAPTNSQSKAPGDNPA